jgi:DNA polymerase-3 subunit delta'
LIEYRRLSETTINKSIALDNLMIDYKRIFA